MNCIYCGQLIPEKRLIALPNTQTCVNCSDDKPYVPAHYSGGMAGSMKNCGFNVVKNEGKGTLVHKALMAGRFRPFGCKTAQDFGSQAYWRSKQK